jgi:hypothetical protein
MQQGHEAVVERPCVYVAKHLREQKGPLALVLPLMPKLLGQHFDNLRCELEVAELIGQILVLLNIVLYILKEQGVVTFLYHLTEGCMEAKVAKRVKTGSLTMSLQVFRLESLEALAKRIQVNLDRLVPIHSRVLRSWIRFVEVVSMIHEGASHFVKDNWGIRAYKHRN